MFALLHIIYEFNYIFTEKVFVKFTTVVCENIDIMKTTFDLNLNFYQAFKQHGYTRKWKQRETVN